MITELKSIPDIWKRMPSELHARRFLEGIIWSTGRHCPHCGSVASTALRGRIGLCSGTLVDATIIGAVLDEEQDRRTRPRDVVREEGK